MNYFITIILGYFLGSFPTAFILLKKSKGIDITKSGSGNVGAMNSFEVTNSKRIGILVLLIDALKGWLASFLPYQFIEKDFTISIIGLSFAIIGHCYSIWINFKGGRGLATAAGGAIFISLPILIFWLIFWFISYLIKRDIHLSNILATIFTLLFSFILKNEMISYSFIKPYNKINFPIFVSLIMIIILSKHIEPFMNLIKKPKV